MDDIKVSGDLSVSGVCTNYSTAGALSVSSDGLYVTGGPALVIAQPKPVPHTHDACGGEVFAVALMREYDNGAFWATGQTAWMCPACGVFVKPPA